MADRKPAPVRERVAALGIALADQAEAPRMALSDDDALELARTVSEQDAQHPALLAAALGEFDAAVKEGEPTGLAARAAYGERIGKILGRFWEAFEGQPVLGVEIVRRR